MTTQWFQNLKRAWQNRRRPRTVKSFNHDQQQACAFDTISRGTQIVPLDRIVGSVGRYQDFDSRFRPRPHVASERYEAIKKALSEGCKLPPVKLYQIKDEYYVLDGNHRIAAAKELGQSEVEASILEFIPSKETLENVLYRQRARFSEQTGLAYAITLTEVGQYDYLLQQIHQHQAHMTRTGDPDTGFKQAAADWYKTIYRPLTAIIRTGGLLKFFQGRTLDDLYAYISCHQWEQGRKRKYGIGIDRLIPNNMEAFREKMATTSHSDYPEMLREITAFVLMNVRAKSEDAIMQKLFSLAEVREVHSIHGHADLLVKIVLTRDLLSSDAEIISLFVQDQMRRMSGVVSTQTLIPGRSFVKEE
jgi:hypothetical protein